MAISVTINIIDNDYNLNNLLIFSHQIRIIPVKQCCRFAKYSAAMNAVGPDNDFAVAVPAQADYVTAAASVVLATEPKHSMSAICSIPY